MKKIIVLLLLISSSISLFSQEKVIRYYLDDGTKKEYLINDVKSMSLIKSNTPSYLYVYYNKKTIDKLKTMNIDSLILNNTDFKIFTKTKNYLYQILKIDSIVIKKILPQIAYINPISVKAGDKISIVGTDFNTEQGANFVTFSSTTAEEYISWSDTLVTVKAIDGITSGHLALYAKEEKSNSVEYVKTDMETVSIGTQLWMLKNLDVTTYRNGDPIPEVKDSAEWENLKTGAWCYYNNDPNNGAIYGKLYNWYAVADPRGLAPDGWHIPTRVDWKTLQDFLGGSGIAGGKVKESGTNHWFEPNVGATNVTGFTGLSCGFRNDIPAIYKGKGNYTFFWSTELYDIKPTSLTYILSYNDDNLSGYSLDLGVGVSVRCIWGRLEANPIITNMTPNTGKLSDTITVRGTGFGSTQGSNKLIFCDICIPNLLIWSDTMLKFQVPQNLSSGKVFVHVNGYKSNDVDFKVNLYISDTNPVAERTFNNLWINGSGFGNTQDSSYVLFNNFKVTKYDKWSANRIELQIPNIDTAKVKISVVVNGEMSNAVDFTILIPEPLKETWMLKNLDVDHYRNGDSIPQVTDFNNINNLTTGAWCYPQNDPEKGKLYGKLYNWYAVNDPRGLAPEGWHVANDQEWTNLIEFLSGPFFAGGRLKSTGTIEDGTGLWQSPNVDATNDMGFSAVPAGSGGNDLGSSALLWSTFDLGETAGYLYNILNYSREIRKRIAYKAGMASVRCVKD